MNYRIELEKIYNTDILSCREYIFDKEIICYGAGSLGKMAFDLLAEAGITPKYFVDKFGCTKAMSVPILKPEEIPQKDKEQCLFLVCISALPYGEIFEYLKSLNIKKIIHFYNWAYLKFPKLISNGWVKFHPTKDDKKNIEKVCEILSHDELSLCHYLQFLWWKLRGIEKKYNNYPVLSKKRFFDSPCFRKLSDQETLLDCGCYHGYTINAFKQITNNKYSKIYAIEPDNKNLAMCKKNFNDTRIEYLPFAVSDFDGEANFIDNLGYASKLSDNGNLKVKTIKIDSLDIAPTIIKLHIEGCEFAALNGAENTIKKEKPSLIVLADHNSDGLYKIPLLMYTLGYKLFFNLHNYCGNSAVFYGESDDKSTIHNS